MQTTLLGLAIALILALVTALVGPYFVNWSDHRAFFEREASRLVGINVRVTGAIDAAILPLPSVTLRNIAIGPAGEASRLSAGSLRIELGLGALLRGEIRAPEMRLVAPEFSIGLDLDGRIDWPAVTLATETLAIERLRIEDGRVTLTDAMSGSRLMLGQLQFEGEVISLIGPFRGKGFFSAGGSGYGYSVSAGRSGPEGIRLKLNMETAERPLTIEADGLLAFDRAAPRFDGTVKLARPAGTVLASGKGEAHEPWRLTARIKTVAHAAQMEDVAFQYGPDEMAAKLTGLAEFKFGREPRLEAELRARQLDLDRALATTDAPRRLPFPAVRAFGDLIGSALRPPWPVNLKFGVDAVTLGGGTLQGVAGELRSDSAGWHLDRLDFRAPGFTQVKLKGELDAAGRGLGFSGDVSVNANDPKTLMAWLAGSSASETQLKPWQAAGHVTFGANRIAVERLRTEFERGKVEGSVAYVWPAANRPARLDADLRAGELDLDAVLGFGNSALPGLGLELPGEVSLALDIGRARIAGFEARDTSARLKFDAGGVAIERLSIADFGNASVEASGRIQTTASSGDTITVNLDARELDGVIALTEKFAPFLAEPLRRLAGRQKTAKLRATVSLDDSGNGSTRGKLGLTGRIGAVGVTLSAGASGKPDAFAVTNLRALGNAGISLEGQLEADDGAALLALAGLQRVVAGDKRPARIRFSANGPLNRELSVEGWLNAGPIDAGGKGVMRPATDKPAELALDEISGSVGGDKVQGRLALQFGQVVRVDGAIDAEALDAPAVLAAAIGMATRRGSAGEAVAWSSEPFDWNTSGLTGQVEFKAQRADISSALVARKLHGVMRFEKSELVFDKVEGELAKGKLSGGLTFSRAADGLAMRAKVSLRDADAGAVFDTAGRPAVAGKLAFDAEINSAGRSPAAFIGSLSGNGTVTLEGAQLAGLNPDVFDAVLRAVDLGIPIEGNRIREFSTGVLDNKPLSVARAEAAVSIGAGQARLSKVVAQGAGADLEATASIDFSDATVDATLTLTGPQALATSPGAARPAVLVTLKGALADPKRTVDAGRLASWLTLRSVDQKSRTLDAIERSGRESSPTLRPAPAAPAVRQSPPSPAIRGSAPMTTPAGAGRQTTAEQAPPLPPPVNIPAGRAPPRAIIRPPGLIGAQN